MGRRKANEDLLESGLSIQSRAIFIDRDLDTDENSRIMRALFLLEQSGDEPIQVFISSNGGNVYGALGIYDMLRRSKCEIITVALGIVASMGVFVFLAGDRRLSFPNTRFMLHPISFSMEETNGNEFKIESKEMEVLQRTMNDILSSRTGKKSKTWIKANSTTIYFDAGQALGLGIVTQIIPEGRDINA